MASIYDKINEIKREGSEYDKQKVSYRESLDNYSQTVGQRQGSSSALPTFSQKYTGYGESKYDKGLTFYDEIDTESRSLEDIRAEHQPWHHQWTNNFANMTTIAATVFADAFIGNAHGALNFIFNPTEDDNLNWLEKRVDAAARNPSSVWLNSIQKRVKEYMPTYTSDQYRKNREEGKWYKNAFSLQGASTWWGETMVENAGFTIGMAAAGKIHGAILSKMMGAGKDLAFVQKHVKDLTSQGKLSGSFNHNLNRLASGNLKVAGLDQQVIKAAQSARQKSVLTSGIAAALSTAGEGRQEAINAADGYGEQLMNNLYSVEGKIEMGNHILEEMAQENPYAFEEGEGELLERLKPEYIDEFNNRYTELEGEALEAIETAKARTASMDFLLQWPILMGSSWLQFGRTFAGNFDMQRGFRKNVLNAMMATDAADKAVTRRIVKEGGKQVAKKLPKWKMILRYLENPHAEFHEEMLQASAEDAATSYAGSKLNQTFTAFKLDPESTIEEYKWYESVWDNLIDTYTDVAKYEEGFSGLMMGLTGSPSLVRTNRTTKDGVEKRGFKPTMEGGVFQTIKDIKAEHAEDVDLANAINNFNEDKSKVESIRHLIAHRAYEHLKDESIENNSEIVYTVADHSQFINDLLLFEKAGKLQEYKDYLQGIVESLGEDNEAVYEALGAEVRELSKNPETDVEMFSGTDTEIAESIKETAQNLIEGIDRYAELSKYTEEVLGDIYSESEYKEEFIHLLAQVDNMDNLWDRYSKRIIDALKTLEGEELRLKKFQIVLDGKQQELTLEEILEQGHSSDVAGWLSLAWDYGSQRVEELTEGKTKGLEYMQELLQSDRFQEMLSESASKENIAKAEKSLEDLYKELDKVNKRLENRSSVTNHIKKRQDNLTKKKTELENAITNLEGGIEFHKNLKTKYSKGSIVSNISNLVQAQSNRHALIEAYQNILSAPSKLKETVDNQNIKSEEALKQKSNEELISKLKAAESVADVRDIMHAERDAKNVSALDIMLNMAMTSNENYSPIVAEYNRMSNLGAGISKTQAFTNLGDSAIQGVVNNVWNKLLKDQLSYDDALGQTFETLNTDMNRDIVRNSEAWGRVAEESGISETDIDNVIQGVSDALAEINRNDKARESNVPQAKPTKYKGKKTVSRGERTSDTREQSKNRPDHKDTDLSKAKRSVKEEGVSKTINPFAVEGTEKGDSGKSTEGDSKESPTKDLSTPKDVLHDKSVDVQTEVGSNPNVLHLSNAKEAVSVNISGMDIDALQKELDRIEKKGTEVEKDHIVPFIKSRIDYLKDNAVEEREAIDPQTHDYLNDPNYTVEGFYSYSEDGVMYGRSEIEIPEQSNFMIVRDNDTGEFLGVLTDRGKRRAANNHEVLGNETNINNLGNLNEAYLGTPAEIINTEEGYVVSQPATVNIGGMEDTNIQTTTPQKTHETRSTPEISKDNVHTEVTEDVLPAATEQDIEGAQDTSPYVVMVTGESDVQLTDGMYQGTWEVDIDIVKKGEIPSKLDIEDVPDKYKAGYLYKEKTGAFKYVNEGRLDVGDEVFFIMSEDYWALVDEMDPDKSNYGTNNQPMLVAVKSDSGKTIIDGQRYQIIDTFSNENWRDPSDTALRNELHEIAKKEHENRKQKDSSIEATVVQSVTSNISDVSNGYIQFQEGMRTDIADVHQNDKAISKQNNLPFNNSTPIFAIEGNSGEIITNTAHNILNVNFKKSVPGRFMMMAVTSRGDGYMPMVVWSDSFSQHADRVFNEGEQSRLFQEIRNSIENLAKQAVNGNETGVNNAVAQMREVLFVGSGSATGIHLRSDQADNISSSKLLVGNDTIDLGTYDLNSGLEVNGKTESEILQNTTNAILDALVKSNPRFQVSKGSLNANWRVDSSVDYNKMLMESGVFHVNTNDMQRIGTYAAFNPLTKGDDGILTTKQASTIIGKEGKAKNRSSNTDAGVVSTESTLGIKLDVNNRTYYFDGNNMFDENSNVLSKQKQTELLTLDTVSRYGTELKNKWTIPGTNKVLTEAGHLVDNGVFYDANSPEAKEAWHTLMDKGTVVKSKGSTQESNVKVSGNATKAAIPAHLKHIMQQHNIKPQVENASQGEVQTPMDRLSVERVWAEGINKENLNNREQEILDNCK